MSLFWDSLKKFWSGTLLISITASSTPPAAFPTNFLSFASFFVLPLFKCKFLSEQRHILLIVSGWINPLLICFLKLLWRKKFWHWKHFDALVCILARFFRYRDKQLRKQQIFVWHNQLREEFKRFLSISTWKHPELRKRNLIYPWRSRTRR